MRGRITNALTDEQRLQLVVESLKVRSWRTVLECTWRLTLRVDTCQKEVASRVEVLGEGAEHTVRVKLALGQALAERQETLRAAEKVLDDAWTYAERLSGRARLADSPLPGEPLTATTNPLSPAAKKQHLTQSVVDVVVAMHALLRSARLTPACCVTGTWVSWRWTQR